MVTINASPERSLQLGYAGEDKVTKVIFPYDESWLEYGDGEFFIRVLRPGDTEPYNAQDVTNDSKAMTLTLVVTDVELSRQGYGQMQVVYIGPQVVKKSRIYAYRVSKAIDEPVDPPDGSIINQIVQSIGDLSDLTTTAKTDLVSAINEVNEHSGASVTVDSALSDTSENPVQNKTIAGAIREVSSYARDLSGVIDGLGEDVEGLETALRTKADTQTVSALSDAIQDLDGDVQGLQTAMQSKASTATATTSANGLMSAQDKSKLDGLDNGISDVRVNGTSVVTDGVAEMPLAAVGRPGVAMPNAFYGTYMFNTNTIGTWSADISKCKEGTQDHQPVTPSVEHVATFYGLAKVAGYDEKNSTLPVGQYSEEAKSAISDMLNGAVLVEGTTPTITALSGVRYICGEVATLDFTPCATGICDVVFTSGSAPTVVTLPNTVKFPDGSFTAEANKTYEINILDGVYGVVMAWT